MPRFPIWACIVAMYVSINPGAVAQVLWKEPPPMGVADWTSGPGGSETAPRAPFQFLKENLGGTNPKIDVRDAAGRQWIVKFGGEVRPDVFAARILYAVGYNAVPTFFVESGVIESAHGLKRAKAFFTREGSFHNAEFRLREPYQHQWSWVENPFNGSHELRGLKILIMLLSNWDIKDARDGEDSNNAILEETSSSRYVVTDWGSSFGKSGGFFERDRWDWRGYGLQTPRFARLLRDGSIQWGFRGKHSRDITSDVGVEDIRWLLPYLSRITDEELAAGLAASGGSSPASEQFIWSIRERVQQLQRIAGSSDVRAAAVK